jgi:hypothetical protein
LDINWIDINEKLPPRKGFYYVRAIWGSLTKEVRVDKARFNGKFFLYGFDWCTITHWAYIEE